MGDFQEWSIDFECNPKILPRAIAAVENVVHFNKKRAVTITDGVAKFSTSDGGTATWSFYDALVALKKELIELGCEDVTVQHTWPAELQEVGDNPILPKGE